MKVKAMDGRELSVMSPGYCGNKMVRQARAFSRLRLRTREPGRKAYVIFFEFSFRQRKREAALPSAETVRNPTMIWGTEEVTD